MKFILRFCFIILLGTYPFASALPSQNKIITIYLHNCKNSSRMITANVFNGNFDEKTITSRYTLMRYALLSQQKNIGPGETVAVRCNANGKRRCIVKSENSTFYEVRREQVLYLYHYLQNEHGITKLSLNPKLCGSNYTPAIKPPLTT